MYRRILAGIVIATLTGATAHAQFSVIDPANLAQAVLIADRTWNHWQELRRQYDTIRRMAQGLGPLEALRIPSLDSDARDTNRWPYGGTWIEGLERGDPTGRRYDSVVVPLQPPHADLRRVSGTARETFERQFSTIEITDAVAMAGGHQVGTIRVQSERLSQALRALEADVLSSRPEFHEMTAVLGQIASGELLARRQDMAANQLLTAVLEQQLARSKRLRDAEASALNMQITTWRLADAANRAFVAGTGDALQRWRQP